MTRKEQYLLRRQKYTRKYRRQMKKLGSTYRKGLGHGGPKTKLKDVWVPSNGKQLPKRISGATNAAEPPHVMEFLPFIVVTGGTGYGTPVHQHVDPALEPNPGYGRGMPRSLAWWGGHQRRRMYVGHKPGRLNGLGRQLWGAAVRHYRTGVWPDWDPLQRSPSQSEVDDPESGIVPDEPGSWV